MLRLTMRDLLWLTVVVALATMWWMDRRAKTEAQASLDAVRQELASTRSILTMGGPPERADEVLKALNQASQPATLRQVRVKKRPSPSLP